jgi:hypothetical protein
VKLSKVSVTCLAAWTAIIGGLNTGCASGGYKLTRQYAGFVNKQNLILRVVLYLLTGIVFAATMLIDLVIFNTMDFWEGRVSQGTYNFNKDGVTYVAEHSLQPGGLRQSKITTLNGDVRQEMILRETAARKIQVVVDGVLKGEVSDLNELPKLTLYNSNGQSLGSQLLFADHQIAAR